MSHHKLTAGLVVAGAGLMGVTSALANGTPRSAGTLTPPKTITGSPINRPAHTLKPGTTVTAHSLSQRVFVTANIGFALSATGEAQYPARTTDGGKTWATFGPALHVNAAQAPFSVTEVGAAGKRTVYFYGSGQAVDVTSDGGAHWYRALAPELSLAVVPGAGKRLVWIVQDSVGSSNVASTWQYVSTNGGKVWKYSKALGGGF
jgi:hypothetical protein